MNQSGKRRYLAYFSILYFFLVLLFLFAPSAKAQDLSVEYNELLSQKQIFETSDIENLKRHHVIVCRGFLGEIRKYNGLNYFDDQIAILEKHGVSYSVANLLSNVSETENSKILNGQIYSNIFSHDKPILLLTHSRGGLIALRSLLENSEVYPHIGGWISIQSPFYGTRFADWVLNNKWPRAIAALYLSFFRIDLSVLREFSVEERTEYTTSKADQIRKLLTEVPVITYASEVEKLPVYDPDYYKHPSRGPLFIENSDGLVDFESMFLYGSQSSKAPYVIEKNVDHLGLVSTSKSTKSVRVKKTQALFKLILNFNGDL